MFVPQSEVKVRLGAKPSVLMPNRRLNHCCCFTVREGSLILGVVGIVCGLLAAIAGAILLHSDISPAEDTKYDGLVGWCERNLDTVFALMAGVGMVTVACNILLVIGVRRRVPCLIRPWMALCFAYLSLMTLGVGKALFYSLPVEVASGNLVLLVSLPNLYVGVLMWFCVYSHYKELEEQNAELTPPELKVPPREELPSAPAGFRMTSSERAMQRKMVALEMELAMYNLSKKDIWA